MTSLAPIGGGRTLTSPDAVPARRIEERLEEIARELMTVTAMLRWGVRFWLDRVKVRRILRQVAQACTGAGITNGNGNLNAGKVVTLTVAFSEAVTVNTSGGTPTLALNDVGKTEQRIDRGRECLGATTKTNSPLRRRNSARSAASCEHGRG